MRSPREIFPVQPGSDISSRHVNGLAEMVAERTYHAGRGCRARVVPGYGVYFEAEDQYVGWNHAWEVSLTGVEAKVAPGLLAGEIPWLDDGRGLRALDGLDEEGEKLPAGAPVLRLSKEIFDEAGYSWIVLRAFIDAETGARALPKDGGLTLAQVSERTWRNGGSLDQVADDGRHYGDYPLAMLRRPKKDTEGMGRVWQSAMFHLQHRFVAGEAEARGRHFFWV